MSTINSLIQIQAFVHEIAHAIEMPAWTEQHDLKLPSGRVVNGDALIREFGQLVETLGCGPISHYSSTYWQDGHLPLDDQWGTPIREELVESITAHLLGFAFCESVPGREGMGLDPFQDRPEVETWVENFLNAEAVPKGSA